jgi:thiamine-monophosphate kinase
MNNNGNIKDEFSLIDQITNEFTSYQEGVLVPNGDDAAIYKPEPSRGQIVCVDTMVEGIHFKRETMSPFQIGYKSLAVNLSDIAAMGGEPTYFLVSLAISPSWTAAELKQMYQGMKELADLWKIDLLGGDIVSIKESLVVTVTAIGQVEEEVKLLRSNAQAGDVLFVTGTLGDAAAGLDLLLNQNNEVSNNGIEAQEEDYSYLIRSHQQPAPHINQGRILAEFARNSLISLNDVSDGLASEAHEIAVSSKVKLIIEKDKLPLSPALCSYGTKSQKDLYQWVFNGGEDFVLVGTLPKEIVGAVQARFSKENLPFHLIGYVVEGNGEVCLVEDGREEALPKQGYNHFGK